MNSTERRGARFLRRDAEREAKRRSMLSHHDDFGCVADFDNLYLAFRDCMRGVSWKESVQRYYSNALRNIMEIHRKLLDGEILHGGFVEFTIRECGKTRNIKSIHISERILQKCLSCCPALLFMRAKHIWRYVSIGLRHFVIS